MKIIQKKIKIIQKMKKMVIIQKKIMKSNQIKINLSTKTKKLNLC